MNHIACSDLIFIHNIFPNCKFNTWSEGPEFNQFYILLIVKYTEAHIYSVAINLSSNCLTNFLIDDRAACWRLTIKELAAGCITESITPVLIGWMMDVGEILPFGLVLINTLKCSRMGPESDRCFQRRTDSDPVLASYVRFTRDEMWSIMHEACN